MVAKTGHEEEENGTEEQVVKFFGHRPELCTCLLKPLLSLLLPIKHNYTLHSDVSVFLLVSPPHSCLFLSSSVSYRLSFLSFSSPLSSLHPPSVSPFEPSFFFYSFPIPSFFLPSSGLPLLPQDSCHAGQVQCSVC